VASRGAAQTHRTFATPNRTNANSHPAHVLTLRSANNMLLQNKGK
jgi:hypothetical protein